MTKDRNTVIHTMGMRSAKYGGMERFMLKLCEELNSNGVHNIVIYEQMPSSKEYISKLNANAVIKIMPARGKKGLRFFFRFFMLLIKERPIAVHSHFAPASYISQILAYLVGVKIRVSTFHSMLTDGENVYEQREELGFKTSLLKKIQYRCSNYITAVSGQIKTQYDSIFSLTKSKVKVLYLGVPQNRYSKQESRKKLGIDSDVVVISCVAFHDKVKGIDTLIEAIKVLSEICCKKFIVCQVGSGAMSDKYHEDAKQIGVDKYIKWMGLCDNVPEILAASDIYVQPSRSEGISLAIMEADMASLPVIASNVGGIPEAVKDKHTGYLIDSESPLQLVEYLKLLIENPAQREKMGLSAKRHAVSLFNIEEQTKQMSKIYLNEQR